MIYLIGPYTSTSLQEHRINIGRLFAYYTQLHKDHPEVPIICWPLMTAGFERILPHLDHQWIGFCTDLIEHGGITQCYVVPGYEGSSGCQQEITCADKADIPWKELSLPGFYTQQALMLDLMQLRNRNEFARWAMQWLATL